MSARRTIRLAVVTVAALAVAGCGSSAQVVAPDSSTQPSPSPSVSVRSNSVLSAGLPERVRSSGAIVVATDASLAPNEFLARDGRSVQGMDVDLFDAVAAKLGVKVRWQPADFSAIIAGVRSEQYDAGVSSVTIDSSRLAQVTMVSYFSAGTQWVTKQGNPQRVNFDKPCGRTVAVQSGTVQESDDLGVRQQECEPGNQIKILAYRGQEQAAAAVVSGKADAMVADSPVAGYAVKQSGGQLEPLGDVYDAAPYGYVLPKADTEFGTAIVTALEELRADGTYQQVLAKWGVESGAIDEFAVNPR